MYKQVVQVAKRYPIVVKLYAFYLRIKYWFMDVRSAVFSRSIAQKMTPYGFYLSGTNSVHHRAMQEGSFEPAEVAIFSEIFGQVDVFVDVGANIGFYSCLARQADIEVVALEPLEKNLQYLRANLAANDWDDVEVCPIGVSSEPGVATLYGGSSTGASLIGSWAGSSRLFKTEIELSTLDEVVFQRFSGKKIFLKVDVEGAEFDVLLGARRLLAMHPRPVWVIEICFNEYHPEGMNPHFEETFALFWQHGYEIRTADGYDTLVQPADVKRWVEGGARDSGTINYKFIPGDGGEKG